MKPYLVLLGLSLCTAAPAAGTNTNRLAIYLVAESVPTEPLLKGTVRPDALRLAPEPVISDADFVAYNRTNHTFEITLETAKRLVRRLNGQKPPGPLTRQQAVDYLLTGMDNRPFVLTAFGKPIYFGVFYSQLSLSSIFVVSAPGITYGPQTALPVSHKSNILLSIELHSKDPGLAAKHGTELDVRDDPRILEALRRLGL
jgi:hypothetical protein